ncbi:MAG: vitamin K epoxide reductase family protein, partial [Anaerolineae bacterium]|nr:vitamin K epoxide reductase family protein [Anaerolineae bacterium]
PPAPREVITLGGGEAAVMAQPPAAALRLAALLTPRLLIPALAVLGILDSIYLSYVKIAHAKPFCAGVGDCETVNTSVYSVFMGVPIAYLGVLMYATLFVLSFWGARLPEPLATYAPLLIMAISFGGVLYSAYLTYLELYVIEAICVYCVVSATLITLIFLSSLWLYWRDQRAPESA